MHGHPEAKPRNCGTPFEGPASPHPALSRSLRAEDAHSAGHHPEPHNGLTHPSAGSGYGYDPSESYSSDRPGNNSTTS